MNTYLNGLSVHTAGIGATPFSGNTDIQIDWINAYYAYMSKQPLNRNDSMHSSWITHRRLTIKNKKKEIDS
ncbi:MAG: hypothetical protein IPL26_16065 [Leptospiraceae bacterium]|nr:hypothetical protein [Leptospiraceae bacterium]